MTQIIIVVLKKYFWIADNFNNISLFLFHCYLKLCVRKNIVELKLNEERRSFIEEISVEMKLSEKATLFRLIYFNRSTPIKFWVAIWSQFFMPRCYWQVLVVGLSSGYHLLFCPVFDWPRDPAAVMTHLPLHYDCCPAPANIVWLLEGKEERPRDYQKFVPGVLLLI